jgi:hypothetical protein
MQRTITCPNCGTPYATEVYQIIDAGRQPILKQYLLSGQLNMAVCPNCGAAGRISMPLLYHDPAHDLFMVHVPSELNLNQTQREEMIGRLVKQAMDETPAEQRRGYMFQPQTMLTMQSFLEKVLETEGITPEMIARQQKQAELLRTLATADSDVQDYLIKERGREIDETFFAMLQAQVEAAYQLNDNKQLIPLINLQARLMTETPIGRQLEKRQIALRMLGKEAQKSGGLSPKLLLKHVLANQEDEMLVEALGLAGQAAMTYEFFTLLSNEIERQQKARDQEAVARLTGIRERLLALQETLREQSQQMLQAAKQTLDALLAADDKAAAVRANLPHIDDTVVRLLMAEMSRAEQSGRKADLQAMQELQNVIVQEMNQQSPPELELLNELLSVETESERKQLIEENRDLLTPEFLEVLEMIEEQVRQAGPSSNSQELGRRLAAIKTIVVAELGTGASVSR